MAYAVLPSMRSRHNAGHDIVWCRSWSAKRDAVLLDLQRLAGTHPDEVALQLRAAASTVDLGEDQRL